MFILLGAIYFIEITDQWFFYQACLQMLIAFYKLIMVRMLEAGKQGETHAEGNQVGYVNEKKGAGQGACGH